MIAVSCACPVPCGIAMAGSDLWAGREPPRSCVGGRFGAMRVNVCVIFKNTENLWLAQYWYQVEKKTTVMATQFAWVCPHI